MFLTAKWFIEPWGTGSDRLCISVGNVLHLSPMYLFWVSRPIPQVVTPNPSTLPRHTATSPTRRYFSPSSLGSPVDPLPVRPVSLVGLVSGTPPSTGIRDTAPTSVHPLLPFFLFEPPRYHHTHTTPSGPPDRTPANEENSHFTS